MSDGPTDEFLIAGMLGGDSAALRKLIDRYDRLVRFTILRVGGRRCVSDPMWLDAVASETWTGFVQSLQRDTSKRPDNVKAYISRIARNRSVSALRGSAPSMQALDGEDGPITEVEAETLDPSEAFAEVELLQALRGCLGDLDRDDRQIADQLDAITQRKWRAASEALGVAESTLRSRWKVVLKQLRGCVQGKTGISLAPKDLGGD